MVEAHIHPVPADTSVVEEVKDFSDRLRYFVHANHSAVNTALVLAIGLLLQPLIMRHELKRLHFNVEIWDSPGDHGVQRYLGDDMTE